MTDNELIPVTKHGEYLEVHPVALSQHEALGWVKCARQEPADNEPDGAKKASVADLRDSLAAAGVTVPDGAKKADLVALLTAFERSGLSGADWNNLADEDRAARVAQ
ncbi:HeH/LEM domain-containing protein [Acidovorax sp. NB1]|uniref:HeH/LEM domain-containing protein n=1 Tax=Acidovorax sp. NB1 TaxID=1943571 RepID=UPI0010EAC248|nr:HeH/LEM domain-containing protein [Acidovorax sp. NB1]GDY37695.1 hypothetical protein ACINB_35870 [Acidovorax sp. NB1]